MLKKWLVSLFYSKYKLITNKKKKKSNYRIVTWVSWEAFLGGGAVYPGSKFCKVKQVHVLFSWYGFFFSFPFFWYMFVISKTKLFLKQQQTNNLLHIIHSTFEFKHSFNVDNNYLVAHMKINISHCTLDCNA
ncbi:hypothetical protein HanRHA438_Chr04g0186491 [Helianthus annuus]|nr:hypothetical protein HanRHA438_Chr04g0186491 [Helianthus annuus]